MKFRIFGDLDCPDWLLAEVFAMSKLSVVKLRLVCSALVKSLPSSAAPSNSPDSDAALLATVAKHTVDAKFTERDNQALVSALTYLFASASKYSASPETLGEELQQLGLPKEHAGQIVRVYSDAGTVLVDYANAKELRLSRLASLSWSLRLIMPQQSGQHSTAQVRLKLGVASGLVEPDKNSAPIELVEFEASEQRLRLLKYETARLLAMMEQTMRSG